MEKKSKTIKQEFHQEEKANEKLEYILSTPQKKFPLAK